MAAGWNCSQPPALDDGDDPIGTATRIIFHIPSLVVEAAMVTWWGQLFARAKNISWKLGFYWLLFVQQFILRFDFKC